MTHQTIGLLGGSFDPAHAGHVALTRAALARFGLDRVWWLVPPQNPLKSRAPASLEDRMARARHVMDHPRVTITDIEARLGTTYTADTIRMLTHRYPRVRFVWLMGADNLVQFDQWKDWEDIVYRVPIGILARPGHRQKALNSVMARRFRTARLDPSDSRLLAQAAAPAWCFCNMPMQAVSSTALRAAAGDAKR